MNAENDLRITPTLSIPMSELSFKFVRSSGPGGQHVNKTSTQVELRFDLLHTPSVTEDDRRWLLSRLGSKLDSEGILQITSQEYRSQLRNRADAMAKLSVMLSEALIRPKKRRATKPTRSAKEKRLSSKKLHGQTKALRRGPRGAE